MRPYQPASLAAKFLNLRAEMSCKILRYFMAVVESAASQSPPADWVSRNHLSQQIEELEVELETPFLHEPASWLNSPPQELCRSARKADQDPLIIFLGSL